MTTTRRALAATTVLAALLTGCSVSDLAPTTTPAPADTTPTSVATTPTASQGGSIAAAITTWYNHGGKTQITQLSNDMTTIATDSGKQDTASLTIDCTAMTGDVTSAQNYGPIPDQQAQTSWASALRHLSQGATDCAAGASNMDATQLTKGANEIGQGTTDMNAVSTRIAVIGTSGQ